MIDVNPETINKVASISDCGNNEIFTTGVKKENTDMKHMARVWDVNFFVRKYSGKIISVPASTDTKRREFSQFPIKR